MQNEASYSNDEDVKMKFKSIDVDRESRDSH